MEDDGGAEQDGNRDSIIAHAEGDYSVAANSIHSEPIIPGWLFWLIIGGLDLAFFILGMVIDAHRMNGG